MSKISRDLAEELAASLASLGRPESVEWLMESFEPYQPPTRTTRRTPEQDPRHARL